VRPAEEVPRTASAHHPDAHLAVFGHIENLAILDFGSQISDFEFRRDGGGFLHVVIFLDGPVDHEKEHGQDHREDHCEDHLKDHSIDHARVI
jgi:hypothetical protein